eukprot:TRINITY_DN28908_c0_g1_i1.p1 TRINITY_DN28908_c0_g1~~TRINITY_DN28908_c0_g1_i1.p1  ORF type:complete len:629 (+),score=157.36 TRINITY_DN28908_c0_g1_i1:67-1953(+)
MESCVDAAPEELKDVCELLPLLQEQLQSLRQQILAASPASDDTGEAGCILQVCRRTVALCSSAAGLLQQSNKPMMADKLLLGADGLLPALLGASVASSSASCAQRGGRHDHFAQLQARRAAAELLTAALEEASPEARQRGEQQLLADRLGPIPGQLVKVLVQDLPDPRLHEALLELLWRGLRHVNLDRGTTGQEDSEESAAEVVEALGLLLGPEAGQRLQRVTAMELLDWGRELALEISKSQPPVLCGDGISATLGLLAWSDCRLYLSAHGLELLTPNPRGGGEGDEIGLEIPYSALHKPEVITDKGTENAAAATVLRFRSDVDSLRALGGPSAAAAEALLGDTDVFLEVTSPTSWIDLARALQLYEALEEKPSRPSDPKKSLKRPAAVGEMFAPALQAQSEPKPCGRPSQARKAVVQMTAVDSTSAVFADLANGIKDDILSNAKLTSNTLAQVVDAHVVPTTTTNGKRTRTSESRTIPRSQSSSRVDKPQQRPTVQPQPKERTRAKAKDETLLKLQEAVPRDPRCKVAAKSKSKQQQLKAEEPKKASNAKANVAATVTKNAATTKKPASSERKNGPAAIAKKPAANDKKRSSATARVPASRGGKGGSVAATKKPAANDRKRGLAAKK